MAAQLILRGFRILSEWLSCPKLFWILRIYLVQFWIKINLGLFLKRVCTARVWSWMCNKLRWTDTCNACTFDEKTHKKTTCKGLSVMFYRNLRKFMKMFDILFFWFAFHQRTVLYSYKTFKWQIYLIFCIKIIFASMNN